MMRRQLLAFWWFLEPRSPKKLIRVGPPLIKLSGSAHELGLKCVQLQQSEAATCDFQHCGILTSVDSDEPL